MSSLGDALQYPAPFLKFCNDPTLGQASKNTIFSQQMTRTSTTHIL